MSIPQTPAGAEEALQRFSDDLEAARIALATARNAEVDAKHARDAAVRKWRLSAQCPKVGANLDGGRVTVAYVAAWVAEMTEAEELAYDLAKTARQAAAEHLRTLREQGIIQQSITKSVSQAYQGTRTGERW